MRRREFISIVGGAAVGLRPDARAQQQPKPVIGYFTRVSVDDRPHLLTAFRKGLEAQGFIEGQNCLIEYRSVAGMEVRLPELVADLVRRRVAAIAATLSPAAALESKRVSNTIPIVFIFGGDPVQLGLVASLNRPGGNVTGVSLLTAELSPKRLELLHELVPSAVRIAVFVNPLNASSALQIRDIEEAGRARNLMLELVPATTALEIDVAFAMITAQKPDGVFISPDPNYTSRRKQIVALATNSAIPACYSSREYVEIGGLMSYGTRTSAAFQLAGEYTGRILKGEKPADLPVQQPTNFELVINLKTAKALGLTVPPSLLAIADEVIE